MKSEYIGLSQEQKVFWQKSFYQTELEILQIAKNLEVYKQLRKQEFLLKIALKNKIGEMHTMLTELERNLPKTHYKIETPEERKKSKELIEDLTLQQEIESIRKKIEELKTGL